MTNFYYYVQTPDEVSAYANMFNAIASILGSNVYERLLRLVFLFGGFFVFAQGVIEIGVGKSSKSLSNLAIHTVAGFTILATLIFSVPSNIIIKSRDIATYCDNSKSETSGVTVSNIPLLLGYAFSTLNNIGYYTTKMVDTGFSIPTSSNGGLSFLDNNGYASAVSGALSTIGISLNIPVKLDDGSTLDLDNISRTIFTQCILIPFSAKGQDGLDKIAELKSSNNVNAFLQNLYENNVTVGGKQASEYMANLGGEQWKCGDLYNFAKPYYNQFKTDSICLYKNIGAGALSIITGQATPPKSNFSNIALQAGLVNSLANSKSQMSVGVSGASFAIGKSKAEMIQEKIAEGTYMGSMLPILQRVLRAILYGFIPFVFAIVLLPGGLMILANYFKTLLWVELWTPTAAILNMFVSYHAQNKMSSIYSSHGLSSVSAMDLLSSGGIVAGLAGYLYVAVPALTWLLLTGSEALLSNLGVTLGKYFVKNIQTEQMNKSVTELSMAKQVSNETGEEFSVAENSHYSALQTGAIAGATLGVQHNAGMANVVENEAYRVNKGLKSFQAKKDAVGTTGEGLASLEGVNEAMKSTPELNVAKRMTNDGTTLNSQGAKIVEQDTNWEAGKANAKLEVEVSEQTATGAEILKRGDVIADASKLKSDVALFGSEKKAAQSRGVALSIETKEQDTDKRIKGKKNADGTANKAGVEGYQTRATNAQLFSIDRTNALASEISGEEVGKADAAKILQTIASQKAAGVLNKDGSVNHEGAENYGSLLGHNAKDMANITRKVINTEGVGNMANAQIAGIEATNAQVDAVGGTDNYANLQASSVVEQQARLDNIIQNVKSIPGNELLSDIEALQYYQSHQTINTSMIDVVGIDSKGNKLYNVNEVTMLNGQTVVTSITKGNSFTAHNFGPSSASASAAIVSNYISDVAGIVHLKNSLIDLPLKGFRNKVTKGVKTDIINSKHFDKFKTEYIQRSETIAERNIKRIIELSLEDGATTAEIHQLMSDLDKASFAEIEELRMKKEYRPYIATSLDDVDKKLLDRYTNITLDNRLKNNILQKNIEKEASEYATTKAGRVIKNITNNISLMNFNSARLKEFTDHYLENEKTVNTIIKNSIQDRLSKLVAITGASATKINSIEDLEKEAKRLAILNPSIVDTVVSPADEALAKQLMQTNTATVRTMFNKKLGSLAEHFNREVIATNGRFNFISTAYKSSAWDVTGIAIVDQPIMAQAFTEKEIALSIRNPNAIKVHISEAGRTTFNDLKISSNLAYQNVLSGIEKSKSVINSVKTETQVAKAMIAESKIGKVTVSALSTSVLTARSISMGFLKYGNEIGDVLLVADLAIDQLAKHYKDYRYIKQGLDKFGHVVIDDFGINQAKILGKTAINVTKHTVDLFDSMTDGDVVDANLAKQELQIEMYDMRNKLKENTKQMTKDFKDVFTGDQWNNVTFHGSVIVPLKDLANNTVEFSKKEWNETSMYYKTHSLLEIAHDVNIAPIVLVTKTIQLSKDVRNKVLELEVKTVLPVVKKVATTIDKVSDEAKVVVNKEWNEVHNYYSTHTVSEIKADAKEDVIFVKEKVVKKYKNIKESVSNFIKVAKAIF